MANENEQQQPTGSGQKITIRVQHKEGFPGVYRAGRLWLSSEPTVVEYFADTQDGNDPEQVPGQPVRIGKNTLEGLKADARFSIGADELLAQGNDVERLRTENQQLRARVEELEKQHAESESHGRRRRAE